MTEIEALREEIAALRREIADLRADRAVHHYHHQATPAPFVLPQPLNPTIAPQPYYPGGPYPTTCDAPCTFTGRAVGIGRAQNEGMQ